MSTLRSTLAKFGIPLLAILVILMGIGWLGIWAAPGLLLGVLAIIDGICLLCAS